MKAVNEINLNECNSWNRVQLKDVATYINSKIGTSDLFAKNYISTENMNVNRGGVVSSSNVPTNIKVNKFKKNDILFSNIRTYFKKLWRAEFDGGASNDVLIIRTLDIEKIKNSYLYYVLSQEDFFEHTIKTSKGTKMPRGDKEAIMKYEFLIPENIETQEKIASILSSLDDKIELNKKMNKTLEEMAQTIFKRWFIDFEFPNEKGEPYKSSGGKMLESEFGEIPEGWEVGSLEDLGLIVSGGTPSKSKDEYYTANGIPWITPKDLSLNKNKFIEKGTLDITEEGLMRSSAKLLPKGTILFSSRAPIGYLAIAEVDVTTNQGFKSIIPNNLENTEFIYQLLKEITPYIESIAGGSTFKEISTQGMKSIKIIVPPNLVLKLFSQFSNSFNIKIKNLEKESLYLTELRDTLLPKLMNGEVEI